MRDGTVKGENKARLRNDGHGVISTLAAGGAGTSVGGWGDFMRETTHRGAASSADVTSRLLQQIEEDLRALSATVTPLAAEEKARWAPPRRKRATGRPTQVAEVVAVEMPVPAREATPLVARGLATAQAAVGAVAATPGAAGGAASSGGKPTGTDLADPRNFGLLPERVRLEQGGDAALLFKKRVADELAFAQKGAAHVGGAGGGVAGVAGV